MSSSGSASDKVTYRAVWGQLKRWKKPHFFRRPRPSPPHPVLPEPQPSAEAKYLVFKVAIYRLTYHIIVIIYPCCIHIRPTWYFIYVTTHFIYVNYHLYLGSYRLWCSWIEKQIHHLGVQGVKLLLRRRSLSHTATARGWTCHNNLHVLGSSRKKSSP